MTSGSEEGKSKNKMAGPSSTSNLTVETVVKMSFFTWDPFNSADWDKEKATPDCILRIKR